MLDCLQVRPGSRDPRRAHAASLLRSQRLGLFADGDASVSGVEVLMALADELCAAAPTMLVIDEVSTPLRVRRPVSVFARDDTVSIRQLVLARVVPGFPAGGHCVVC